MSPETRYCAKDFVAIKLVANEILFKGHFFVLLLGDFIDFWGSLDR